MKKKRRKIGIVLALVFFSTALAVALPKLFQNSKAQTGNGVVISTMSVYKDMDYSFLKKFNFGGEYSSQSILTFNSAVELMESTNSLMKAGKYITTRGYYEAGDFSYFLQVHECSMKNRTKVKVSKWLDTPEISKYEDGKGRFKNEIYTF